MSEQVVIYVDDCAICGEEVPIAEMYPMGADPRLCCVRCALPRGYVPGQPGATHHPGVYSEGNCPQIGVTAEDVDPVFAGLTEWERTNARNQRRGITAI